jgi:putative spermidine/putrescine transport system ATP-binding protein
MPERAGVSVELADVVKLFGRHLAVDRLTLSVREGELMTFLGGSGCGKTTTLRMIAGFEAPTSGFIAIAGRDVAGTPANRRGVGMVFQNYALFPTMTAAENIAFGLKVSGVPVRERRQRVAEMLALIHMDPFGNRYPYELSGGQQQRVALARALAVRPRVLLLDEPLSALDARIRLKLRSEIRSIQQSLRITTIYVTHDQEEALSLSDRVVVMRDGRVEQIGTPAEIYNRPATSFVASFVGSINVLPATVVDPAAGRVSVDGQPIRLAGPIAAPAGSLVRLSLRPELIGLRNGSAGDNHVTATLSNVIFQGSIVRLVLSTGVSELLVDTLNNPGAILPARGDRLVVGFAPEACVLLPDGQRAAP